MKASYLFAVSVLHFQMMEAIDGSLVMERSEILVANFEARGCICATRRLRLSTKDEGASILISLKAVAIRHSVTVANPNKQTLGASQTDYSVEREASIP